MTQEEEFEDGQGFREIDHTGDRGIEVRAETLAGLFEAAARGMFDLLFEFPPESGTRELHVALEASDLGDLMVKWLEELNFLHLTEGIALNSFQVKDVTETFLDSSVGGEPLSPGRPVILTEIKAVTYHGLVVESRNDVGWFARIIFDI